MILCVTPNPAVDRTARVPRVQLDTILRPLQTIALAGGKGLNVARAAKLLGADVVTAGVAGGHAGRWLVEQLEREGLRPHFVQSDVEARTTYVVAGDDGRSVTVYEGGEPQPRAAFEQLLDVVTQLLPSCSYLVTAGSVPPGIDPGWIGRLIASARKAGVPCLADARGETLRAALVAKPDVLKANESEMADAGIRQPRNAVSAGVGACVVTRGARGAIACSAEGCWTVTVPVQRAVNTVGAGDAFSAGLAVSLVRREQFDVALAQAGAAAAASVLELGAGFLDPEKARELAGRVRVRKMVA